MLVYSRVYWDKCEFGAIDVGVDIHMLLFPCGVGMRSTEWHQLMSASALSDSPVVIGGWNILSSRTEHSYLSIHLFKDAVSNGESGSNNNSVEPSQAVHQSHMYSRK